MTDTQLYFQYLSEGRFNKALDLVTTRKVDVNVKNDAGETGLMIVASAGNNRYVSKYIKQEASVDATDNSGNTPLMRAVVGNHSEVVRKILKATVAEDRQELIEMTNASGENALTIAARLGDKMSLTYILSCDVDADTTDALGATPLMAAIHYGKLELLPILKEYEADVDFFLGEAILTPAGKPSYADHPVVLAAGVSEEMLLALREFPGFDVNARGINDVTPLMAAACADQYDTFAFCLENKANVDASDEDGDTVLHHIMMRPLEEPEVYIEEIMKRHPDLTLVGSLGESVEDLAYKMGRNEVIISLGQDPLVEEEHEDATAQAAHVVPAHHIFGHLADAAPLPDYDFGYLAAGAPLPDEEDAGQDIDPYATEPEVDDEAPAHLVAVATVLPAQAHVASEDRMDEDDGYDSDATAPVTDEIVRAYATARVHATQQPEADDIKMNDASAADGSSALDKEPSLTTETFSAVSGVESSRSAISTAAPSFGSLWELAIAAGSAAHFAVTSPHMQYDDLDMSGCASSEDDDL